MKPTHEARRLALLCLAASPGNEPKNALAASPNIARALSTYNLCKALGTLPDAGGLLDQSAGFVAYATVFASAEAEYSHQQSQG